MKYLIVALFIFIGCTAPKPIVKYIGSQEDEKAVVYGSVVVESQLDLNALKDIQLFFIKKNQKEPVAISWSISKDCQKSDHSFRCPIILKADPGEYDLKNIILKSTKTSNYTFALDQNKKLDFIVTNKPTFLGIIQFKIKDQNEYDFYLRTDPYSRTWFEKQYLIPLQEKN